MKVDSKLLDDLTRIAGSAIGAAGGMRNELEVAFKRRLEEAISNMDVVTRSEFDAIKEIALKARSEQELLTERLSQIEANLSNNTSKKD